MKSGSLVTLVRDHDEEDALIILRHHLERLNLPKFGQIYTCKSLYRQVEGTIAITLEEFPEFPLRTLAGEIGLLAEAFREVQPPEEVSIAMVMASVDEHEFVKQFENH